MEPFELRVHQVTFEEGDVNAVYDADLSSNIVNCDYDSLSAEPEALAAGDQGRLGGISPRLYADLQSPLGPSAQSWQPRAAYVPAWGQYGGRQSPTHDQFLVNANENFLYTAPTTTAAVTTQSSSSRSLRENGGRVTESSALTLARISVNTGAVAKHLSKVKKRQARTSVVRSTTTAVTTMPSEKPPTPTSPKEGAKGPEESPDSSFETVAEALKLQWSVIGNKNIAPASPEVVAQIVAEAERKLRGANSNSNASAAPGGSSDVLASGFASAAPFPVGEATPDDVSSLSSLSSTRKSSSSSITADLRTLPGNGRENSGSGSAKVTSPSPQSGPGQQRELIRIPADSMVRTTEKSKTSWFGAKEGQITWTGASAEENNSPGIPGASGQESGSFVGGRGKDGGRGDLDSKRTEADKGQQEDGISFSSVSSDFNTERLAGTDSESLNSFQSESVNFPSSPGDLVNSTPVKFPPLPTQPPLLPIPTLGPLFSPMARPTPAVSGGGMKGEDVVVGVGDARLQTRLEELQRERAKLTGQLEVLTQENQATLQERAQLQAHLASLRLKLLASQDSRNQPQTQALRREVVELQQARDQLAASLAENSRTLEERQEEMRGLQEELNAASESGDKLTMRIKELRDEMRSRDATIQALKSKVAELYVEVQTTLQAKVEADQEARTATNDFASLQNAKDWYGQQLAVAHEVRSKLQRELTMLQAQASAHGAVVERLRLQNGQLRQAMAQAQQRALREKEALARHLEVIETDMMEREAAFQEIQRERRLIEDTYSVHAQTAEEEKSRISLLLQSNKDLEARLDKSMEDMKKKQTQIFSMENEQIDLMKKLTLAQESLQEKENSCEELRQKLLEVEAALQEFQRSVAVKDQELLKVKEEKATAEISLSAALQEKTSVDKALETLQADMGKVEKSFKQMRSELGARLAELEKVGKEKATLSEELDRVSKELDIKRRSYDSIHRDYSGKSDALNTLRAEQQMVEEEAVYLRRQLADLQASQSVTVQEKAAAEAALAESRAHLATVEHQLQQLQASGAQPARQALLGTEAASAGVTSNHVDSVDSPRRDASEPGDAGTASDERFRSLQDENERLQQQLSELEQEMESLVAMEREGRRQTVEELDYVRGELCGAKQSWSEEVAALTSRLQEALAEKQRVHTEMEMLQRKQEVGAMQQQDQLRTELQRLMTELEAARLGQQAAEERLRQLQVEKDHQVAALQTELERLAVLETSQTQREEQYQQLALELEKERGRIVGLQQNNASLKQHVGQLEEALAGRESSLQELHDHLGTSAAQAQTRDQDYIARIRAMEEALSKEKDNQRALRKQIGTKMTENNKLKKLSAAARSEQEAAESELAGAREQLQGLQAALDASREEALSTKAELSATQTKSTDLHSQLETVRRQLEENMSRQPFILDQIQNLQWQLEQKSKELATVEETMRLAEERQQQELEDLHRQLQEKQEEIEDLQQQLMASRQEKLNQRQRVSQLRGALKATVHHHKVTEKLRSKRRESGGSRDQGTQVEPWQDVDVVIPPLPIDLAEVEKLLEDTAVRALDSKPLDNLKSCLSSLRSEISGLQEKMDVHTTTVHSTTQSWRTVESQVQELTEVVRTIANTMSETQNANTATTSVATELDNADGVETV